MAGDAAGGHAVELRRADPALLKRMVLREREERKVAVAQREAQLDQVKREAADQLEAMRFKH